MSLSNKEIVSSFFMSVYNRKDYSFVREYFSPDYFDHNIASVRSSADCENILKAAHGIFPDISCDVLDMIEEDGKVAARIRFRGTHSGEIYGVQGTVLSFVGSSGDPSFHSAE